jgi:hypothetical protein
MGDSVEHLGRGGRRLLACRRVGRSTAGRTGLTAALHTEHGHGMQQFFGLVAQAVGSARHFLHQRSVLLRGLVHVGHGLAHLGHAGAVRRWPG